MAKEGTKAPTHSPTLFLILGNQLFDPAQYFPDLKANGVNVVWMAEERSLATHFRYHQQKIGFFFAAMREYREELSATLKNKKIPLVYHEFSTQQTESFEALLKQSCTEFAIKRVVTFEIEDRFFEKRLQEFCLSAGLQLEFLPSPMFLTSREAFREYLTQVKKPFMKTFYERRRRALKILVDSHGSPVGGQWSFDDENRKKLPASVTIPKLIPPSHSQLAQATLKQVHEDFSDHLGDARDLWVSVTRKGAKEEFRAFLRQRLKNFGDYEDALSERGEVLFHSVLTPALNCGLLTPQEVLDETLHFASEHEIPLNSLEGFVRQIMGWREFIRGVYQNFDDRQSRENFWGHHRKLPDTWYTGKTGIPPLDQAIQKVNRLAWNHHIERLMVVGSLMLLSEIEPREAHRWFMELYLDSSDWVMGPNVYGMALFSDGGIFATKPYICGSNYYLKMSDGLKKGPWCDTVDGLYWSFIDRNRKFFSANPRLSMMVKTLDKIAPERKKKIFSLAEQFRETGRCAV